MNQPPTNILDFDAALAEVLAHAAHVHPEQTESKSLLDCLSRTLAETLTADRDQPPFDRSTRDGFAIKSADSAAALTIAGQIRAGQHWSGKALAPGTAIEIMTGAIKDSEQLAKRERCTVRQINLTLSLAFLAPSLVKAAVEGRLPRGINIERLRDPDPLWTAQFQDLGLNTN